MGGSRPSFLKLRRSSKASSRGRGKGRAATLLSVGAVVAAAGRKLVLK